MVRSAKPDNDPEPVDAANEFWEEMKVDDLKGVSPTQVNHTNSSVDKL